jgi:hypothetical protein
VRLVGMAVLAKHPTVKLDAYRVFEGWQCVGLTLMYLFTALIPV